MAYQSLYRRYRPQRFAEVRGQDHLVNALRTALVEDRVGHAYLLSGPRGTGKTTTARILAKALNCEQVAEGEPCGTCDSCRAIEAGRSFDLQELDAASNRGIGEMKELLEGIALGTPGRRKVYILDEVHMLTAPASAALLKSLEEPPDHVVFVLATTDPQKVLATIRSRTQHFRLNLLPAGELRALVDAVVADAGLEVSEEQIEYALRAGGGSARDTLSALDQVAAAGGPPRQGDVVAALVDGIAEADAATSLAGVQTALSEGWEPRLVGEALLEALRDGFLVAMGVALPQHSEAAQARARELAGRLGPRSLTRALEVLGEALVEMRQAADPRIPLEVALLRLARPDLDDTLAAVHDRLDRLEQMLADGVPVPARTPPPDRTDADPDRTDADPDRTAVDRTAVDREQGAAGRSAPPGPAGAARQALADRAPAPVAAPPAATPNEGERPAVGRPALGAHRRHRDAAAGSDDDARLDMTPGPGAPAPADAPTAPRSPAPSSPAVASSTGPGPGRDELTLAWGDAILPGLSQRVRSRWAPGRFLAVGPDGARYGLPNQITCDRCAEQVGEVEAALAAHFGVPVPVVLVVDDHSAPPPDALSVAAVDRAGAEAEALDPDAVLAEVGPVDQLPDAGTAVDGLVQITEAFPGAEMVESVDP